MVEIPTQETINIYPQLDDGIQFRLNEIYRTKDYFIVEVGKRETMSKTLSKYIAAFDYFGKTLLVLGATSGSVSIASFPVIRAPVGITRASLSFL